MAKITPHAVVHWDGKWPSAMLLGDRIVWAKGTLSRQAQIKAFLGRKRALVRWYAWLVREPTNPHDPNAIAVYLGQHHVGYLAARPLPLRSTPCGLVMGTRAACAQSRRCPMVRSSSA